MRGTRRPIPHLFDRWEQVALRLRASRRVVIFLDFDGTLARIASHPALVRLPLTTRRALERLAGHPRVSLVVLSGRRRAEIRRLIGVRGVRYWGLYGWERGRGARLPFGARSALRRAQAQVKLELSKHPGAWIEDKRHALSVHLLKLRAPEQRAVLRKLHRLLGVFRKNLRLAQNLRDAEILPNSIPGKRSAVRRFLAQSAGRGALAFYFGDDLSDEEAFTAMGRGVAIHVGSSPSTRARYRLRSPGEVSKALKRVEAALE